MNGSIRPKQSTANHDVMETAPATLKALRGGDEIEHPGFEQAGSIDAGKSHGDPRDFRVAETFTPRATLCACVSSCALSLLRPSTSAQGAPRDGEGRSGNDWAAFVVEDGRVRRRSWNWASGTKRKGRSSAVCKPGQTIVLHPPDTLTDGTRVTERGTLFTASLTDRS